jgi:hypothetical protein
MNPIRVFVGYGYNARDAWIDTYVVPLLTACGCTVVHGRVVYGGVLPDEVVKAIQSSDAMFGFTTRRDPVPGSDGQFTTHPWVVQELATANAQNPRIPWVEIREDGVVSPGGLIEAVNAQRIDYREPDRAACLVNVVTALARFAKLASMTTVRLAPQAAVEQIRPLLNDPSFACTCQVLRRGNIELAPQQLAVLPITGALFVKVRSLEPLDLVRITIGARGRVWRSDYESVDTVDIQMKGGE